MLGKLLGYIAVLMSMVMVTFFTFAHHILNQPDDDPFVIDIFA